MLKLASLLPASTAPTAMIWPLAQLALANSAGQLAPVVLPSLPSAAVISVPLATAFLIGACSDSELEPRLSERMGVFWVFTTQSMPFWMVDVLEPPVSNTLAMTSLAPGATPWVRLPLAKLPAIRPDTCVPWPIWSVTSVPPVKAL